MAKNTKKIVYSAIFAAIATLAMVLGRYFPLLSLTPLMLCSICYYAAFECGYFYGFATIISSLGLGLLFTGLSSTFIICGLIFAPYSVMARLISGFDYKTTKSTLIRFATVALLINLLLPIIVFALGSLLDEVYLRLISTLFYGVVATIFTLIMAGFDFILCNLAPIITKNLNLRS